MNVFKRYRIQHIFFGSFFLFIFLFLLVFIYVTYTYSVNQMISTTTDYQKENLVLLTDDLGRTLDYFDDISIMLTRQKVFRDALRGSEDPYIRRNLFSTLSQDFSNIIYSVPGINSIEVYMEAPPHNVLNQPVQYYHLSTVKDLEWSDEISNRIFAWIGKRDLHGGLHEKSSVVSLARNVYNSRGDLEAIILLNINEKVLDDWIQRKKYNTNLLLLDRNGSTLADTNTFPLEKEFLLSIVESALQLQEERSRMQQVEQKAEYIVVTTTIPSSNWTIMEITPYEELTKGSKVLTGFLILIGAISLICACVATLLLTKKFTDPIMYLTKVLKRYPKEDISEQLPNDYRNEFGQLYKGYRDLIKRSDRLYNSLIEQHQRQREAEIKALQANINPHFLYNTLDQLNWSAIERGDEDMSLMLELLGNMLRIGLSKGESIITIDNELKYLDYYLRIQEKQMGDRLSYEIDAPESILHYYIPKLTLQPFVENSIIHGFHDGRKGSIKIEVKEQPEELEILISDNGLGIGKEGNKRKVNAGGYGTFNVVERLDIFFGEKASVTVQNQEQGGTVATIRIPKIIDKDKIKYKEIRLEEPMKEDGSGTFTVKE